MGRRDHIRTVAMLALIGAMALSAYAASAEQPSGTVTTPTPVIDSIQPTIAKPGKVVTVKGQDFLAPSGLSPFQSNVWWDGSTNLAASTQFVSTTELKFEVPDGQGIAPRATCGPHQVTVRNQRPSSGSKSKRSSQKTLRVFCIGGIAPSQGGAGTTVTVKGGGFTDDFTPLGSTLQNPGSEVELNGQPVSTTFVDGQTLEFTVPSGTSCGSAQLQVVDPPTPTFNPLAPSPSPRTSNTITFNVTQPCGGSGGGGSQAPTISSVTPSQAGSGTTVTVKGRHFTADSQTSIGGQPSTDPGSEVHLNGQAVSTTFVNSRNLEFTVPSGTSCGTAQLQVVDPSVFVNIPPARSNTVQLNVTQPCAGAGGGGGGGQNQPPNAGFSVSTSSPSVGQSVQFTNNSSDPDNDPLSFQWDFGDGNSSSNTSPTHTYSSSGSFTVQLTVTDGAGNTDTASQTINVQSSSGGGGSGGQSGLAQYDTNNSCSIEQSELVQMINDWVDQKIPQSLLFDGINAWINQTDICAGSSSVARRSMEDVRVQSRPTASGVQFVAEGAQVQAIDVEVFGLNGQTIAERRADRAWLAWNLTTDEGARIANGVYLYRVTVHGPNGNVERTDVRKLTVLR